MGRVKISFKHVSVVHPNSDMFLDECIIKVFSALFESQVSLPSNTEESVLQFPSSVFPGGMGITIKSDQAWYSVSI